MLGDFDTGQIWNRGGVTVTCFLAAILVGNVCLLNLLIAIVSAEFDSYTERAELESLFALGEICQEARVVHKLDARLHPPVKAKAQCWGGTASTQCVCHLCHRTWTYDPTVVLKKWLLTSDSEKGEGMEAAVRSLFEDLDLNSDGFIVKSELGKLGRLGGVHMDVAECLLSFADDNVCLALP